MIYTMKLNYEKIAYEKDYIFLLLLIDVQTFLQT